MIFYRTLFRHNSEPFAIITDGAEGPLGSEVVRYCSQDSTYTNMEIDALFRTFQKDLKAVMRNSSTLQRVETPPDLETHIQAKTVIILL